MSFWSDFVQDQYSFMQKCTALNIMNHEGNASHNHNEILPHSHHDSHNQKNRKYMLARVRRMQNKIAIMEKSVKVPQKIKSRITL